MWGIELDASSSVSGVGDDGEKGGRFKSVRRGDVDGSIGIWRIGISISVR